MTSFPVQILSAPTPQCRSRRLLDKLLRSRNDAAFVVLREGLRREYHWMVKTIDTEIAAQAHQQVMMDEHRALIEKLQQDKRKLEDKVGSSSSHREIFREILGLHLKWIVEINDVYDSIWLKWIIPVTACIQTSRGS